MSSTENPNRCKVEKRKIKELNKIIDAKEKVSKDQRQRIKNLEKAFQIFERSYIAERKLTNKEADFIDEIRFTIKHS